MNILINNYMSNKFPNRLYNIRKGNNCEWITMGNINMYFIIRDNQIIRVDID